MSFDNIASALWNPSTEADHTQNLLKGARRVLP
jgi:hypothetical protein